MFKACDFFPKVVEREKKMERNAEKKSLTRVRPPLTKELILHSLISSNTRHETFFVSPPFFLRYIKSVTNHFKLCTFMFRLYPKPSTPSVL